MTQERTSNQETQKLPMFAQNMQTLIRSAEKKIESCFRDDENEDIGIRTILLTDPNNRESLTIEVDVAKKKPTLTIKSVLLEPNSLGKSRVLYKLVINPSGWDNVDHFPKDEFTKNVEFLPNSETVISLSTVIQEWQATLQI